MMIPDNVWLRNPGYARVGYGFLQGVMTIGRSVHETNGVPSRTGNLDLVDRFEAFPDRIQICRLNW